MRLDTANRYVHAAVSAVARGVRLPAPPSDGTWTARAAQHGVLSVLACHLSELLPDDQRLRAVRTQRAARHLNHMADLRTVQAALAEAGLEWLLFKGPLLSEIVYRRPGTRDYDDLDVLVRADAVGDTVEALRRRGAVASSLPWREKQRLGHGELLMRLPRGSELDLHWDVLNEPSVRSGFSADTERLFAGSRVVDLDGIRVRTLGTVDTLLHTALHAAKSGADRLRWLLDVHQCLGRLNRSAGSALLPRSRELGLELVLRCQIARVERFIDSRPGPDLPPPDVAQAAWLTLDDLAARSWPPGSGAEGRFSGAIVARSARARPRSSWSALARQVPVVVRLRYAGERPRTGPEPVPGVV